MDEEDLVDLARLVLDNNYFEFDDKIYWQKVGTAIGSMFVPAFGNIFMTVLERNILAESVLKQWVWWRLLDDVFFLWTYGKEKLLEFFDYINSYHQTIMVTREWSMGRDLLFGCSGKTGRKLNYYGCVYESNGYTSVFKF